MWRWNRIIGLFAQLHLSEPFDIYDVLIPELQLLKCLVPLKREALAVVQRKVWKPLRHPLRCKCLNDEHGFSHHFFQEPVKKKGRTVTTGKVKEEPSSFLIKPKTKKPVTTKKENPAEKSRCVDLITDDVCRLLFVVFFPPWFQCFGFFFLQIFMALSSLELPYVTPLENKQRKSFTSKALYPLTNIPKTRPVQKQRCEFSLNLHLNAVNPALCFRTRCVCDTCALTVDGKLEDARPSLLAKLLSSGSVPELGHSSSSEGEKEFPSPEWDVPLSKNSIRKSRSERNAVSVQYSPIRLVKFCFSPVLHTQKLIVFSRSPSRR